MDGTVLIADDDRTIRTVLSQALGRAGCKVHATTSMQTLLRWVDEGMGDLVITDVLMPDGNGLEALPQISARRPDLPVIVISAQNTIMTAVRAAEAEAHDYLPKPFDLPDLMHRVAKALEERQKRRRSAFAPAARPRPDAPSGGAGQGAAAGEDLPLIGRAPVMQELYRLIARLMNADLPLLIRGESGSGKTLVARTIHQMSERRSRPLITVVPADLEAPEALAQLPRKAAGGTLLIDEIADLGAPAQASLVRLIDAGRQGGTAQAPRFLVCSQHDPQALIERGEMRQDLIFRIGALSLQVPPLRDRVEDILLLSEHFLARFAQEGLPRRQLSKEAADFLRAHPWPGNVRQLENALQAMTLTASGSEISLPEARAALEGPAGQGPALDGAGAEPDALSLCAERALRRYFDLHGGSLPPAGLHRRVLDEVERPLIEIALEATGGNQARCAELLGINRNTLRKKIHALDIRVTRRSKLM